MDIGPVTLYLGLRPLEAETFRVGCRSTEVLADQVDAALMPTSAHAQWVLSGAPAQLGRPKPLFMQWRNRQVGPTEARLRIYIPMFVEALCRNYVVETLTRESDIDAAEFAVWAGSPDARFNPRLIIAAISAGVLSDAVRVAALAAGLGILPACDQPPNLAPFHWSEQLPGLGGGADVAYRADFLNRMSDRYFGLFAEGGAAAIPWERRSINIYGRECLDARATAYYGDEGTSYRYSGSRRVPLPWSADPTGALAELLGIVRRVTGKPFNFLLANLYRPEDSVGAHSDDERDLVVGSGVFSVSLGRCRRFVLIPKSGSPRISKLLAHGSALYMAGRTQKAYKHAVAAELKPQPGDAGPFDSVNLTFRCVRV